MENIIISRRREVVGFSRIGKGNRAVSRTAPSRRCRKSLRESYSHHPFRSPTAKGYLNRHGSSGSREHAQVGRLSGHTDGWRLRKGGREG